MRSGIGNGSSLSFRAVRRGILMTLVASVAQAQAQTGTYVIRGGTIVPIVGAKIPNGNVVISGGKIQAVGANVQAPQGATVIDATGLFVYPGMIDGGTTIGLTEIGSVPGSTDTREIGRASCRERV